MVDGLFLRQQWAGAEGMLLGLLDDPSPLGRARLAFFLRNKGPWDRLDHDRIFVPGAPPKPEAGTYYPPGTTKEEIAAWMAGLPEKERAAAGGFYTVVRRTPAGFAVVPYSVEYQAELALAASLLRQAAAATAEPTLKRFLETRAAALLSDDYYESDVAWMELDAAVEPTFGPYETYEDGWFNAKAAFESFVTIRDDAETRKVARLSGELQDIEDHLPMDPAWRNPKLGALAPIRVVNEIFAAGDGRRGVTTAAFNLPNDERILREKGAKRVMLKNVQEAKFQKVLLPISKVAVSPADGRRVSFDAFFTHILMHEMVHGLGPHGIERPTGHTTVREQLGSAYPAIEEAKADVVGLFALHRLVDRGVLPEGARAEHVRHLPGLGLPLHPLRRERGPRAGRGAAAQLVPRPGRRGGGQGRPVLGGGREDPGRGGVPLPGDPGHPGPGRRGRRQGAPRPDGGDPPAGGAGARAAARDPGGRRAPLRHRGEAHRPVSPRQSWSAPITAMAAADTSPRPRAVRGPMRPARPKATTSRALPPTSSP